MNIGSCSSSEHVRYLKQVGKERFFLLLLNLKQLFKKLNLVDLRAREDDALD